MARPFLDANVPLFIEKPLAITTNDLDFFKPQATAGKLQCFGGAHLKYKVQPDMAIFAKALDNGHPIAALAVLKKMRKTNLVDHIDTIGKKVISCWKTASQKYGVKIKVCESRPCVTHFSFEHQQANKIRTIYAKMMLDKGFIANTSIYPTLAQTLTRMAISTRCWNG